MTKTKTAKMKSRNSPSETAIVYNGPIRVMDKGIADDSVTQTFTAAFTNATGGTLGLQNYYSTAQVSSASDFASSANTYDEMRVLGFEVTYHPHFELGNSQVSHSAGFMISTHNPNNPGPFTSLNTMAGYQNWVPFNTAKVCKMDWKMASTEEAQFYPSSSPPQSGWIYMFAPAATNTGNYGFISVTYRVQFRGRK